ncbi:hypothetical protein [Streptomyces canus]|uniref:hypothetical protein n=1 Tax=Streptomyces canus TaxID=58343 RepID=UPI001319C19A|nr:hypothetical protein [Streptomyces canus]
MHFLSGFDRRQVGWYSLRCITRMYGNGHAKADSVGGHAYKFSKENRARGQEAAAVNSTKR